METKTLTGLTRVTDLVGVDVAGLRADVRCRVNGKLIHEPRHYTEFMDKVTLKRVYTRKPDKDERAAFAKSDDADGLWYYIEYDGAGCGRSGRYGSAAEGWEIVLL